MTDALPKDFWQTGPLCQAHGGTAGLLDCKACKLALPFKEGDIFLINEVWVPFEVMHPASQNFIKCMDLPRFSSQEEVKDFLQFNAKKLANRLISYQAHKEVWAFDEFMQGVGRKASGWAFGPPLHVDEAPINPQLYEAVKKLSKPN